jgi:hypothetical protein
MMAMPVTVEWHNPEQTIIHFQFIAPWTWTDYTHANQQAQEMMGSIQNKTDLILNFQRVGQMPPNSLAHLRRAATETHPNQGTIVIIGMNAFVRMIGNVMETVYPKVAKDRKLAVNLQDAERIIAEIQQKRSQRIE